MVIAVDFDGTLCAHNFPEIGVIYPAQQRVIDFIKYSKNKGDTIILWTCRENTKERKYLDEAVNWCKNNNIPIDYVNENSNNNFYGFPPRKIFADMYIDDKAVNNMNVGDISFYVDANCYKCLE